MQAWDTNLVSTNGKYLALNWNAGGGGAFAVLPLDRPGKLPDIYPLARGHTATVLDTAWSPFHDDIVVSASDDGSLGVWRVDASVFDVLELSEKEREKAGGVPDMAPLARINTGTRKIGQVVFHPTAENVVAASTGDHQVRLYDLTTIVNGQTGNGGALIDVPAKVVLTGPKDSIQSMDFDFAGDRLAVTSRDKQFRIYDTRKGGEPLAQCPGHEGVKGARVIWCGDSDRVLTTGFTKTSNRQIFLWNVTDLAKPIKTLTLDTSSGVTMPFWSDNQVVFLAGKGDGNTRYYELDSDELYELSEYKSIEPQRGMTFAPRRTVNAAENEIARAFKVTGNMIQPVSFQVPRRAESFQSDIFPPAYSKVPALKAADFFAGKRSKPNLVNLQDGSTLAGGSLNTPVAASSPVARPVTRETPSAAETPSPVPRSATPPPPPVVEQGENRASNLARPPSPTKVAVPEAAVPQQKASVRQDTAPEEKKAVAQEKAVPVASTNSAATDTPPHTLSHLQEEIDLLKEEMAKRDTLIRKLEVENERLRSNERRVREAIGAT